MDALRNEDRLTPDLVFRDPYLLDCTRPSAPPAPGCPWDEGMREHGERSNEFIRSVHSVLRGKKMRTLHSIIAILTCLGILLTAACGPAPTPAPTAMSAAFVPIEPTLYILTQGILL